MPLGLGLGLGKNGSSGSGGGGTPPSGPPTIGSGTINLHLDPALGISATGSAITQWIDQAGSRVFTVEDGSPVIAASDVNGLPAVVLTNDTMTDAPQDPTVLDVNDWVVGIVHTPQTAEANGGIFEENTGSGTNRGVFYGDTRSANGSKINLAFDASARVISGAAFTAGITYYSTFRRLGDVVQAWTNETSDGIRTGLNGVTFPSNTLFRIGKQAAGNVYYNGKVHEIVLYIGPISDPDLVSIRSYLKTKFGL